MGVRVLLALKLRVRQAVALREAVAQPLGVPEPVREPDNVPLPVLLVLPLALRVPVGQPEGLREGVGVPEKVPEALPQLLGLGVGEVDLEGLTVPVTDPVLHGEALELKLAVIEDVRLGVEVLLSVDVWQGLVEWDWVRETLGQALLEGEGVRLGDSVPDTLEVRQDLWMRAMQAKADMAGVAVPVDAG